MRRQPDSENHDETTKHQSRKWWIYLGLIPGLALILVAWGIYTIGPKSILQEIVITISEDTEYSSDYSEKAFLGIKIGDSEASVLNTLGVPLSEVNTKQFERWLYAKQSTPGFEKEGQYPASISFVTVDFDEHGKFNGSFGQTVNGTTAGLAGVSTSISFQMDGGNVLLTKEMIDKLKTDQATKKQIEMKLGKPRSVFKSHVKKWLIYSRSPGSNDYRQRKIGIDQDGKVSRIISKIYWD